MQFEHLRYLHGSTLHVPLQLHYLLLILCHDCSPLPSASAKNVTFKNLQPHFLLEQPALVSNCEDLLSAKKFISLSLHYNYNGKISLIWNQSTREIGTQFHQCKLSLPIKLPSQLLLCRRLPLKSAGRLADMHTP